MFIMGPMYVMGPMYAFWLRLLHWINYAYIGKPYTGVFITWISVKSVLLTKWVETARNRVLTTDFETSRRDLPEKNAPEA